MLMMYPMPTLDEMLSNSASSLGRSRLCRAAVRHSLSSVAREPRVNESEHEYKITVSAPGVRAQDLSLCVEDDILKIQGETETSSAHTHFINWATSLPRDADAEKATASHIDGLLQVTIPKKQATKIELKILADGEVTPDDVESHYTMRLNCAGIAKADLKLTVENDLLTVTGETKSRGAWLCPRKYRLPNDADGTKACASYIDGILTIVLEKKATAEPKRIEVNAMNKFGEVGADDAEKTDAEMPGAVMDTEDEGAVMV